MAHPFPGRQYIDLDLIAFAKTVTATRAQINAGLAIVAAIPGATITPIAYTMTCIGAFGALTDIRISTSDASPVDIFTVAQADLTDGSKHGTVSSTTTLGAGFAVAGTKGKGINIRKTGSTATTATSATVTLHYKITKDLPN